MSSTRDLLDALRRAEIAEAKLDSIGDLCDEAETYEGVFHSWVRANRIRHVIRDGS